MSITSTNEATQGNGQRGHCKPLPLPELIELSRLRVGHLMTLYGLSHTSVYDYLNDKLIPPPDGFTKARPFWKLSTIRDHLAK